MKFAVIEYTSKTQDIWRHTDEKPNYLADPAKEMDPTSFGCYVSALRGEHIPLTKLIGARSLSKRVYRKLTGHWPNTYSLEYLKQFDALLMVYDLGNGPTLTAAAARLKRVLPHIRLLGVPTQPYGIIRDYWQSRPQAKEDMKQFMAAADAVITIAASTKEAWQSLTSTPVYYLPQPYPAAFARKCARPRTAKENIIFIAGVTSRDNILKGCEAAVRLQEKHPEYIIHITGAPGEPPDTSRLSGARFEVMPFEPWQQHLQYISRVMLTINTDYTQTRGRVQVDCAAVGTPSIGANSDGQADLFPHLPAGRDTSIDDLVLQGTRLLNDTGWYDHIAITAYQRLQKYDYKPSAERITALIKKLAPEKKT